MYALDAGYNTIREEKDPLTIPAVGIPSGRAVLVPGYMAGVEALHRRFGKLKFASLFDPAIWIAEKGIPVNGGVARWLSTQQETITRLPEGKRLFTKPDGSIYERGDVFKQPELAATLKKLASEGSRYMYRGQWARRFVEAARREDSKITMADLRAYRAEWKEPARMPYRDSVIIGLPPPNGGSITLSSLKMAEVGDVKELGHYSKSAEALYYLSQISRLSRVRAHYPPDRLKAFFPDLDFDPRLALTEATAKKLWAHLRRPDWLARMTAVTTGKPTPAHSAGIVAVDEQGNVAAALHTINTNLWGSTGLFVDGISIPDSAAFQQYPIAWVGAGVRLPETTNPLLVFRRGKPMIAAAAIGSALHDIMFQNLISMLDFGMDARIAVSQPNTQGMLFERDPLERRDPHPEAIAAGEFPQELIEGLEARGQPVRLVEKYTQPGYWIGIKIDPQTGQLEGAVTSMLPAHVEGF